MSSVCYIVPHVTGGTGTALSTANYWASTRAGSTHYVVEKDGHIAGCVDETKIAWSIINANSKSISIEMTNTSLGNGGNGASDCKVSLATLNATAKLMADIANRLGWDYIDWDCPTAGTLGNTYRCTKTKTYTDSNGKVHGYMGGHCWFAGNNHACPAGYMKIGGQLKGNNGITGTSPLEYLWLYANNLLSGATPEAELHWISKGNFTKSGSSITVSGYSPYAYTSAECCNNANIVANYCINTLGMTKQATCGILGNMTHESGINPNIFNASGGTWTFTSGGHTYTATGTDSGYGLCQWTYLANGHVSPLTESGCPSNVFDDDTAGADANGNWQLQCIETFANRGQWNVANSRGWSWSDYKNNTIDVEDSAEMFFRWYEYWSGGTDGSHPQRRAYAKHWYDTWDDWYGAGSIPAGGLDPYSGSSYEERMGKFWLIAKGVVL